MKVEKKSAFCNLPAEGKFASLIFLCKMTLNCYFMIFMVGYSAYGDQIMLQFIVHHQPQITLEELKEVRGTCVLNSLLKGLEPL